ncbi:MAG: aminotransferase class V-fold PLP-dependent enzyme [Bacteroidetes bacterium]|nr:aminotransferase class V-fold PLP-dependent enzyme [Bacteroidota bacterium]
MRTPNHLGKPADLTAYRSLFPHTGDQVYLNHAAVSPLSVRVTTAIQDHLTQRSTGDIDVYPGFSRFILSLKDKIGRFIGATAADIALTSNTSDGLNILANALKWKRGDRIIMYERDFPSVTQTFSRFIREGVVIDLIRDRSGRFDADDIRRLIRPETQLVCISQVQFLTGLRLQIEEIGALCHEKGILFAVDGSQSAGAVTLDVKKMKIDFLAVGAQKWMMGPMGTGFVFASEELRTMLNQAYVGWLSVENPWDLFNLNQRLARDARRYETGTLNAIGLVGLGAAIDLLSEIGIHKIESQVVGLATYTSDRLLSLGYRTALNYRDDLHSGIVSFIVQDPGTLSDQLKTEKITISAREKYLRVSPHFYNTRDDIDRMLDALKKADARLKYTKSQAALSQIGGNRG